MYAPLAWVLSHFFGLSGIFIAAATANFVSGGIGVAWFRLAFNETRETGGGPPGENGRRERHRP